MSSTQGDGGYGGVANPKYAGGAKKRAVREAKAAAKASIQRASHKVQAGTGKRHPGPVGGNRRVMQAGGGYHAQKKARMARRAS